MALAANLARRQSMVRLVYPTMTVYSLGDTTHQAEKSDHNPDARGIWHALDIMTETDAGYDGAAAHILAWLLSDVTDLQYVIHDDRIYGRNEVNGWAGAPYDPTNPNRDRHTNHIHASGKHGSVGKTASTGTGYDPAAEAYTPGITLQQFMEALMPLSQADADLIATTILDRKLADGATVGADIRLAALRSGTAANTELPAIGAAIAAITPAAIGAAVVAALPPSVGGGLTEAQVGHAVHAQLVAQAAAAASAPEATT